MNAKEAKALIEKHGSQQKAARAAGCSKASIWKALHGGNPDCSPSNKHSAPSAHGKSLSDFRAVYDKAYIVPRKIKDALKSLGTGWEYEVAFAKMAGVSLADLGAFRDEFSAHVVALRDHRRAWAGTKSTADAMRSMI